MIKGILFDKDGTIIDFFKVWQPAVRPVLINLLSFLDLPPTMDNILPLEEAIGIKNDVLDPEGALAWKPYEQIAADLAVILEKERPNLEIGALQMLLERYFSEHFQTITDYPVFTDMVVLFEELRKRKIKIGIVTTDNSDATQHCLSSLAIEKYVSYCATADSGHPIKPSERLFRDVLREWQLTCEEVAVVGDTPNDMRFALNGGGVPIGVLSGVGTYKSLSHYTYTIIPSLAELLEFIDRRNEEI